MTVECSLPQTAFNSLLFPLHYMHIMDWTNNSKMSRVLLSRAITRVQTLHLVPLLWSLRRTSQSAPAFITLCSIDAFYMFNKQKVLHYLIITHSLSKQYSSYIFLINYFNINIHFYRTRVIINLNTDYFWINSFLRSHISGNTSNVWNIISYNTKTSFSTSGLMIFKQQHVTIVIRSL